MEGKKERKKETLMFHPQTASMTMYLEKQKCYGSSAWLLEKQELCGYSVMQSVVIHYSQQPNRKKQSSGEGVPEVGGVARGK